MDIRFLESLIAVVETGSIAAAARSQNLTAAAIGQRIRALEKSIGQPLLYRSGHKAQPTPGCLNLLPRAHLLVRESQALKADLDHSGLTGSIRLGAISTALSDFMPNIIKHISLRAPGADISIIPGTSAALYDMLIEKKLDAAIMVKPAFSLPKQIQASSISRQRLVLISGDKAHTSPQKMLKQAPLIVYDKASWGGRIAWDWVKKQSVPIKVLCEVDSPEMIAILVEQGLGIAVLPEWKGLRERHAELIVNQIGCKEKHHRDISFLHHTMTTAPKLIELAKLAISIDETPQPPHA